MITREQYLEALDIVEAYHKQVESGIKFFEENNKTMLVEWLDKNRVNLSTRLFNSLHRYICYHSKWAKHKTPEDEIFIEDLEFRKLMHYSRGMGKKTLSEFEDAVTKQGIKLKWLNR